MSNEPGSTQVSKESHHVREVSSWESTAGFLILRLFLAVTALMNGTTKCEGVGGEYSFGAYATNMKQLATQITEDSFMPLWLSEFFAWPLGFLLILLGLGIFMGCFMRIAIAASGFLYVALAFGLLASKNSPGVAWLGIYVGLVVLALRMANHNRFQINRW